MIFLVVKTGCRERKLRNFKRSSKTFIGVQNLYQCHLFPFNLFILTDWQQQETLGCSEFAESIYLLKQYFYIVAYLRIMLQAFWHIAEGN